jgi:NADH pyrophosphatase NudC (nudix superfamily)
MKFCPQCATPLVEKVVERPRLVCPAEGCGFVFWDNPLPVVAAIVEHEGQIVLVRQPGWPPKFHGLVTGFLEKGETPEQAVVREVQEELGLAARVESLVGVYEFIVRNQVIIAYHVVAEGTITLGSELEAFKAVPREKLRPWPMGTGHAIRDWLARRGAGGAGATK